MDERLKLMMLLNMAGAGPAHFSAFSELGVPTEEVWNPKAELDAAASVLPEKMLVRIRNAVRNDWAEREFERAAKLGAEIITIENERYPKKLLDLKDAPLIIYWSGCADKLAGKCVAVVGTRKASQYGKNVARSIGKKCAGYGAVLVSGGAWGIDGCSQGACIEAGGVAFSVLGTGIDIAYPAANRNLFARMKERGALISEFPIGSQGEPWRFPKRNRIVAALADAVIVVEAPLKSGSMITARLALELGRDVWAVPGRICDLNSEGTNRLIFDGAYPYIDAEEFFGYYGLASSLKNNDIPDLSEEESKILEYLTENGAQTVDSICAAVKMSAAGLIQKITLMSAKGLISMPAPGRYAAKDCK